MYPYTREWQELPREVVREAECPRCGAAPGSQCWGRRRKGAPHLRTSNHLERVRARLELQPQ